MSNSKSEDTHFKTQVLGNTAVSYRLLKNDHLLLITVDEATGKWEADEVAGVDPKNPIESIEDTPPEPPQDTSLEEGSGNSADHNYILEFLKKAYFNARTDVVGEQNGNLPHSKHALPTLGFMAEEILQWHKSEQAKLLQVIEDELDKSYSQSGKGSRPQFSKDTETRREYYSRTQGFKSGILVAKRKLNKLKDNVINGGSL